MPRSFGSREQAQLVNCDALGHNADSRMALRPALWEALARGDWPLACRIQRAIDALYASDAEIRRSNVLLERQPRQQVIGLETQNAA